MRHAKRMCPIHCHLRPVCLYNVLFLHYLKVGTIFGKELLKINCVLIFTVAFLWNISKSEKNLARSCHKFILVFMYSICYYCQILMKIENPDRLSENPEVLHFMKIRTMGEELFHGDGRTDEQTGRQKWQNQFHVCLSVHRLQSSNIPHPERIAGCPAPDLQQPATKASHTIGGNNTHIVSSSWWWA